MRGKKDFGARESPAQIQSCSLRVKKAETRSSSPSPFSPPQGYTGRVQCLPNVKRFT